MTILNKGKKQIISIVIPAACICYIVYTLGILLWATVYTVPTTDDFIYANQLMKLHRESGSSYLRTCLLFAAERYLNWQGTYTSMFLQALFSPMNQGGMASLRATMLLTNILFFIMLICLLRCTLRMINVQGTTVFLFLTALLAHLVAACGTWQEDLFWFSGSASYTMPAILLMASLCFVILSDSKDTHRPVAVTILACITGILAMGGSLIISAIGCWLMLVRVICRSLPQRRPDKRAIVLFACYFAGALVNALAPGNFSRQIAEGGGDRPGVFGALSASFFMVKSHLEWLTHDTTFGIVLFLLFAAGFYCSKEFKVPDKLYVTASVLLLVTPFVSFFPVVYGYGLTWMPARCVFISIIVEFFCYGNIALMLGRLTGGVIREAGNRRQVFVFLAMLIVGMSFMCSYRPSDYRHVQLQERLKDRTIQEQYVYVRSLLESLPAHAGEDITAQVTEDVNRILNFYSFALSSNPDDNTYIAELYGIKSIRGVDQLP